MMSFVSVRLRLTILYIGLLAVTLALFGSFLYLLFYVTVRQELDDSLTTRSQDVIDLLNANPIEFEDNLESLGRGGYSVQLISPAGRVVQKTSNLGTSELPVDTAALRAIESAPPPFTTVQVGNTSYRVRTFTVTDVRSDRLIAYLQVARPLDDINATMNRLRQVLLVTIGITLAVAAFLGSIVARRAFRPIDRMTRTARRIGVSGNLSERVPDRGRPDELGRLAATFNDMLDRLQSAYTRQEEALSAQRRFVADASHELRTPLTTIRGNLDFVAKHPDLSASDREEALEDAASEARRMSRLVEDLLFLARVDAGQRLPKVPMSVDDVVRDIARQARRLARQQTIQVDTLESASILGSPDHIRQLLLILIDNALKYTPADGTVRISMRLLGDPPVLGIAVADTGPGIDPAKLPHIFDRFYRADPSRGGEGAGLGLAIAKWLAEEHGGTIEVASEPGIGSIFTLWLPALTDDERLSLTPQTAEVVAAR